jgi:hypothetical protein
MGFAMQIMPFIVEIWMSSPTLEKVRSYALSLSEGEPQSWRTV